MIDNQAAREGDDRLGFLRNAVRATEPLRREDVMGDALRRLGIDAKPQKPTPAPSPEISGEQAASSRQANIATMMGRYLQSNPTSSPLRAAAGLMGDMAFAGLGGQIKGDADPLAIRTAMLQEGATAIGGEMFGSVIGGMANAGATAQKTVGQAVNTATRWYTGGRDVFDLDISDRTKQFLSGGYSSRNALMDSAPENRARFIRSNAAEAEAAAATGMSSPMAFNVGDAMGQIGLAVLSSLIPGGQAAGAANAAKATTTFGKAFNAVRTWTSNPGAKLYLGYAGAQSGIGMSAEMDAFRRRENEAIDLYNESIERLGLPFEKRAHVEYDRLMDMGVSVASGIGTAALETVTVGLAKFGGGRIARRMMFGKAETLGGIRDVIRASVTGFAIGGAGEGLEEALDVYKDGFLRGIWNPYEEARFLRTFKGEDFWKTLKSYAPEAIDAAVTSFIAAGPLGGAGGAASVRRSGAATVAFHHAFMRDQMSREQGSGPDVIASGLVARQIAERVMLGNADPQVQKVVLEQLRSTGLAEAGSVTAEQMTDPEWVRSFVRRNPLLAAAIADRFDSLSRSNIEWMTGPASRGRVPNADQRQQFLNMVKGEVRSMVPAYMRGWADRAARRYSELARTVDEISREMSGLEGEALEQAYARRLAAHAEMSEIRQINERMKAARVRGEVPTEQEFREWQVLTAEVEAVDLDGTADAEADSPATEALEAAAAPEQAAPEQAEQPPMSEAKRLRILAREGDPDAAFRLAEMHETGEGAERHAAKAEYWLNVALAAQGDADALFYLGEFYRLRVQSESGLKKAIVLLSRAARAGSTRAQAALGEVQAQRGNVAKASDLFRKAGQDGSKGIARLVLTGQLPPSEISTELIQNLEQLSLAGDPEAAGLFRWAIDARRQALPARATETPSAASAAPAAPATATEAVAAPAASEPVAAAEPAAIPADDPVARGVQRLLDAQQARRDAEQAEKDAKKAELERRARVRAERAEAGRRKAAEAKARVAAETAVEPEAVAEPVAQPQPEAASAVQAEPAPEPVQDEAARIQERIRRSEGSTGRERVRMVEPDTTVRKRIARAAAKLGRRVQFIAVEKSSGVIRGFVSPDSDTIYLAVLPVQAERQSPEQVVESYYLQALLHENAHLSLEDGAIRDRVDGVITDQLKLEFASRFDLGGDAEAVREEVRVYTLTQDIVGSSGAADIVLGEGIASAVSARIKELFAKALPFLPNARRKALLASMIKEQVREAKAAKPKPLTAASLNAAVAAGDTVTATTERGGEMREVSYGKDAEFIERKGVLYAKQGKTLDRLDSPAVVPAKPAVGKAKAKKATPKPEAKPQAKPKRGRGETGDGQGVLFMREIGGFTTFSGGGLMDIAMEQMGIRSDGRIEIRGDIAAVADQNLPGVTTVLSILDADPAAASRSDILHGSPVCKGYSCANATNHERELDILTARALMRFLETNRNPIFTLENVRKYGRPDSEAMNLVKATLDRLGYTYDINVYNAADYGAAQFRERLMLRAVRDGDLPPMPEPTHGPGRANPYVGWFERVSDLIDDLPDDKIPLRSKDGTKPSYIAERLARIGIDPMNVSEPMLLQGGSASSSNLPIARASEPSWTVKSTHKEAHRILMPGGIVKRVTPRVLARLQGMPDSYKLPDDIALATTIVGNGVPVELGRAVLGSLVGPAVNADGGLRFMREIDPDIDRLLSVKVAGHTVRDALLSTPKNHPYRDIAVAIAEFPISFINDDRVGNKRYKEGNFYSYDAAFEGQPRINLSSYTKYSTLIHEAVHAFTAESVKRSMLFAIGRRDLAAAEGVDPASLSDDAVFMARRLAKANLIERWELDGLLKAQSEDARQSLLKMALLKRYVKDVKGDANIRTDAGYMAMVDAAIADPKTPVPVRRLLELFKLAKADSDIGATATPNNRLMAPGGWDTVDTGGVQSEAEARSMRESLDIAYGLSNPLEFAAMAFSSPPFQRWLNERGGDGRKSLWERFVAIVSRILGVKNDSMLESVIEASADLSTVRPDGVRFMRERTEGPVPDGMTRLYRVQPRAEARRRLDPDSWQYQAMESSGSIAAKGRWFTDNPEHASFYVNDIGRDNAEIVAVDVPTADLDKYRVSNFRGGEGVVDPRRFSARGMAEQEFFLPRNVADAARPSSDIRFMRERPAVASVKRFLSRIAPGSEFADNLATSFVWEYAILDREINRVAKEYGLEDEYRANDMLKVSPGKRAAAMLDFQNMEVRPFEAAAEGLAKRSGMPVDQVLDKIKEYAFYVQSQDAAKVLELKAGENRDLVMARAKRLALESGIAEDEALIQVYENMTSLGLTPEDAAAGQARLEREFASDPMWMELVDRLRAMNRRTLEIRREAGLITEETYRKLVARYPNFVPVVRSIYDNDVDVDGTTYMPKNIKKRAVRTMISGQLVEESKLRTFWGASLAITQLDRNAAINQAARNSADNVLFLLSNQVDLETGEPIVGVNEDGETIGLQARSGKPLLEPLYVDEEVRKVITLATVRAKTPRREDESPEEYRQRIEREVAFAQGQAMADMRTRLDKEASGEKPTLRRFKLDRDLDLTPPEVYEEAEQIMSSPDGLSDRERAENAKLEKRIAEEKARLASPEFAARVAEIDREIKSLEASRRPGVDSTGIDARIDMLKKEKLLPKRRINSARSRMVRARNAEQREEARNSLLERKRRFYAKGEVMYYRINEPTLAQAMLVMRKTPLERMAESPLAAARVVAKGWFGVMSMMRFAYVQASLGFLVGEMQRSPQQATIMARILAAEYDLDSETSDKFIKGLAGKVGGGAYFMPKTAVFGAIKAMPFNKASRSIKRIMRGETPSNDYERMVRQAIEDGVLQGQLYSVDSFELARKRVVADLKRLETGDVGGILGNAKKATRKVGEVLDLTLTAIDLVNRMHVYTAAVEAGISRQTATVMARESLVDFAKKGTAARGIGQVLLFFSPRMQGIHQLTRSFSMLRSTGTRLAVRALAAKFLWSFISSMARELFYEDDEDASTMISKFAAERNLIVPAWKDSETGEWKWVQIAEPYGFGAVSRAGTAVADMLVGDVSPVKTFATVAGAFASEVMPLTVYDPTSLQSWFQAGVPTPLGPLLDVAFNTDYKGSPIAPLGAQFGAGDPRTSEQFFADTPIYYIKAAALLSAITAPMGRALGGAGSRGIEVSPNQIEYLLGRFLPGVVNDAVRLWETGSDKIEGANVSLNEWPVLSKVVGESGGRRVLPGRFRDIDAVFERIRTDLRYESRADVLGGASTLERWLANNSFWPNARRSLKALQERRNVLLRAGNRVEARKIEEKMNAVRLRAVNQALRIQNLESGPGYDTEIMRYFRGGSE